MQYLPWLTAKGSTFLLSTLGTGSSTTDTTSCRQMRLRSKRLKLQLNLHKYIRSVSLGCPSIDEIPTLNAKPANNIAEEQIFTFWRKVLALDILFYILCMIIRGSITRLPSNQNNIFICSTALKSTCHVRNFFQLKQSKNTVAQCLC